MALGATAALALTGFLESLLYEVSAINPFALAGASLLLAVVALAAHLVPICRALRLEPASALRQE